MSECCETRLATKTTEVLFAVLIVFFLPAISSISCGQDSIDDYFERVVRPILVANCTECHGAEKQEAGLRLDQAEGWEKGGDSGPILDKGSPERGLLLRAISYQDDLKMPPANPLNDKEKEAIATWVRGGAVWPKSTHSPVVSKFESLFSDAKSHWSFQSPKQSEVPLGLKEDQSWLDAFLSDKRDARLDANPRASEAELIRRLTLDLTGVPSTFEEVVEFTNDHRPDAFDRLCDRLLASPRFGEKQGRHWLDVARFADTKGYTRLLDNPRYPASWTYRDYVIDAFNQDLPYAQFVLEQLAGDQIASPDNPRPLAALGFLTCGQRFLNSQPDIIDDQIDVVTRGFLGMTAACARCHDHKFEPISMRDYYGLYGVFQNSIEPPFPPLIVPSQDRSQYAPYITELERRVGEFQAFLKQKQSHFRGEVRRRSAEYLLAGSMEKVQPNYNPVMFLIDAKKDLNPTILQRWARRFENERKHGDPVLHPFVVLSNEFEANPKLEKARVEEILEALTNTSATIKAESGAVDTKCNGIVLSWLKVRSPRTREELAKGYAELFAELDSIRNGQKEVDHNWWAHGESFAELEDWYFAHESPETILEEDIDELMFVDATTQNEFHTEQRKIEDWINTPNAAPHAQALFDASIIRPSFIFLRGNASNPGPEAPRKFLDILAEGRAKPFHSGSGRLELASEIASESNPLTARVIVNRLWQWHFGNGLVPTSSDFGLRGDLPSHPELLDFLAVDLMKSNWSLKGIHRRIICSAHYQQSSQIDAAKFELDAGNQLLSRMNRRKLSWEEMRDSLLFVSGELDLAMSGPSPASIQDPNLKRRAIYGMIDRQNLSSLARTFDFAAPDNSVPKRSETTVPLQALFLFNSEFIAARARSVEERITREGATSNLEQITTVYRTIFAREPNAKEFERAIKFLSESELDRKQETGANESGVLTPLQELIHVLLMSNEFMMVD